MTRSLLVCRSATRADTSALSTFVCTVPATKSAPDWRPRHPRFWELEAQNIVRALRPAKARRGRHILVWHAGQELAAVACVTEQGGPDIVHIEVIAVAMHHQGRGHGAQVVTDTLLAIRANARRAGDVPCVTVTAHVYRDNARSRAVCAAAGLGCRTTPGADVEIWAANLDVG